MTEISKKEVREEKKEAKLSWEARPFNAFGKTTRINSKELAAQIKEQFQQTFHDCIGCYINFTNNFAVTLFFEKNATAVPEGKISNLVDFTNNTNVDRNDLFQAMKHLSNKASGKTFALTDMTKELLAPFMYGGKNAKRDWKQFVSERRMPAGNIWEPRAERVIIAVAGLDLNIICRSLFGNRMVIDTVSQDGKIINKTANAFYQCRYGKQLPDSSIMINIEQFDVDSVESRNKAENPQLVQANGILMY